MGLFNWGSKKKKQEEAAKLSSITANKQKQNELGARLFKALIDAAKRNKVYNLIYEPALKKEVPSKNLGEIKVQSQNPKDGAIHSVLVWVPDKTASIPPAILQVDVDVQKDKVCVKYGAYGSEETVTINNFDKILEEIVKYVEKWKLYKPKP